MVHKIWRPRACLQRKLCTRGHRAVTHCPQQDNKTTWQAILNSTTPRTGAAIAGGHGTEQVFRTLDAEHLQGKRRAIHAYEEHLMRPKSIVITGASSGIGASLTRAFGSDGHDLFVCARREDGLAEATSGLKSASFATCDVGSESDVRQFFEHVGERFTLLQFLVLHRNRPAPELDEGDDRVAQVAASSS